MNINDVIKPFSMMYKGELYKVTFDHKDGEKSFLNVQHILDGTEEVVPIMNYAEGSGNEHLVGTLHYMACEEYCGAMIDMLDILASRMSRIIGNHDRTGGRINMKGGL
jgi:hypothetical protein